jgi:hypothetical protein
MTTRIALVSLGTLNGTILEAVARSGLVDEIVVLSRNADYGQRKVNTARVGAAVLGKFPRITFVPFDFNAPDSGERLAATRPTIVVTAPSLMPWWAVDRLQGPAGEAARAMPFAGWVACHVAPMLAFRRAWVASGLGCPWVNLSYPDAVNAVLHRTGAGPLCGAGNVEEAVPKARFAVAEALGVEASEVEVRLVAPHALEYHLYAAEESREKPPCLLKASYRGRDVSEIARDGLFRPMPILYDMDFNLLTQASTMRLLGALLGKTPTLVHVPGPEGRVGGYPVQAANGRISLDLPPEWSEAEAIAMNERALAWDGISAIGADGTIEFTDATATGLRTLLGREISRLRPAEAAALAAEQLAAVAKS